MIRALSDQNVRSLSTLPNSQEELWTRAVSPPSKDDPQKFLYTPIAQPKAEKILAMKMPHWR